MPRTALRSHPTRILAVILVLYAMGCGRKQPPLTIGSKDFTEQLVLGEIIAQHLENRLQRPVDRKLGLGGTLLAHQALLAGEIDLYPEYTGAALATVLKLPPSPEPALVLERVRMEYRNRWGIEWLDPLGFSNDFTIVVRGEDARAHGLATLSDAERYEPGWALGAGHEFLTRPDGFPALMKAYNLRLTAAPKAMGPGLLYQALGQNQVSLAAGGSTDGPLSALDVKVLQDDRSAFAPQQAAVAVRADVLSLHPGLRQALSELSGRLPAKTVQQLNYLIDGKRQPIHDVARQFLSQAGFLGRGH